MDDTMPAGTRVLLVEDEPLIALDAQDTLRESGASEIIWARNLAEAEAAIEAGGLHAAILDLRLGSDSSLPLAHKLVALGVPFGFMTGFQDSGLPPDLKERPFVTKPYSQDQLRHLLKQLLNPDGSVSA
jgi:DNA-binding response OmpR family regulator